MIDTISIERRRQVYEKIYISTNDCSEKEQQNCRIWSGKSVSLYVQIMLLPRQIMLLLRNGLKTSHKSISHSTSIGDLYCERYKIIRESLLMGEGKKNETES